VNKDVHNNSQSINQSGSIFIVVYKWKRLPLYVLWKRLANVQQGYLMSRKYPGSDFEKRWVFSRWRNVDNDWEG